MTKEARKVKLKRDLQRSPENMNVAKSMIHQKRKQSKNHAAHLAGAWRRGFGRAAVLTDA